MQWLHAKTALIEFSADLVEYSTNKISKEFSS